MDRWSGQTTAGVAAQSSLDDLAIGRTGLRDAEAVEGGFHLLTVATVAPEHVAYYPEAHPSPIG